MWRTATIRQARTAVEGAVAHDEPALDTLAVQYRSGLDARTPPRLRQQDLSRVSDLMTVLGDRAPQVSTGFRPRVAAALRDVRVASHEAEVIALLSVGEYFGAAAKHRHPSLDVVRTRYEHDVRPGDPALEAFDTVISGTSMLRAQSSTAALNRLLVGRP